MDYGLRFADAQSQFRVTLQKVMALEEGNYLRHIRISRGSLMELETQLELSVRLNLLEREHVIETWKISQEVGRMLTVLASRLKETV